MMTKQYLKMADAFAQDSVEALEQHIYAGHMSKHCCEYAAHAINSHDELVVENERLRNSLCVEIPTCGEASSFGNYVVFDTDDVRAMLDAAGVRYK